MKTVPVKISDVVNIRSRSVNRSNGHRSHTHFWLRILTGVCHTSSVHCTYLTSLVWCLSQTDVSFGSLRHVCREAYKVHYTPDVDAGKCARSGNLQHSMGYCQYYG